MGGYTGYPLPFLPPQHPPQKELSLPACYPDSLLNAILEVSKNTPRPPSFMTAYVKMLDSRVRGEGADALISRTRNCPFTREVFSRCKLSVSLESFLQLLQTLRRAIGGEGISKGGDGEGGVAWPGGGDCTGEYGVTKGDLNNPFKSWFGVGSSFLENWRDSLVPGRAVRFELQAVESKFVGLR